VFEAQTNRALDALDEALSHLDQALAQGDMARNAGMETRRSESTPTGADLARAARNGKSERAGERRTRAFVFERA